MLPFIRLLKHEAEAFADDTVELQILTNLLIALMTSEYEKVVERADEEVNFNRVELAYDLTTQTSRLMPPPLNILVRCHFSYW